MSEQEDEVIYFTIDDVVIEDDTVTMVIADNLGLSLSSFVVVRDAFEADPDLVGSVLEHAPIALANILARQAENNE
jgi:hypothetical protein